MIFLGGLGGSGSQLKVVKLTASDGFPCKPLHIAWTLGGGDDTNKQQQQKTCLYIIPRSTKSRFKIRGGGVLHQPDMIVCCWSKEF